jgi:hypothetical protein
MAAPLYIGTKVRLTYTGTGMVGTIVAYDANSRAVVVWEDGTKVAYATKALRAA